MSWDDPFIGMTVLCKNNNWQGCVSCVTDVMKIRNEEYNRKDVRVGLMNKEEELRNKNEKWIKTKIAKRLN